MDFSSLKRNSGSNLDKLAKAVEAMSTSNNQNDDSNEYWKCELDKSGNGYAIIRFLPTPPQDVEADGLPWVKYYDHGFQGPGGWYIEKSLTTIGQEDPVSKYNSELWETGIESNKEQARKQKRRLHYVSNVYVVKDFFITVANSVSNTSLGLLSNITYASGVNSGVYNSAVPQIFWVDEILRNASLAGHDRGQARQWRHIRT